MLHTIFSASGAQAQNTSASVIDVLEVQFWPDYDQRSLLVLLTGTLATSGTVSVPFPEDADFLVLARIDSTNTMIDDIGQPIIENGIATFTLPAPDVQFRLEYYVPYTANGNTRSFAYTWQADIPVNQFVMRVQRPAAATSLTTVPAAAEPFLSQNDGLLYYELPVQAVAAGQPLTLQVNYTMGEDVLSVSTLAANPVLADGAGQNTAVAPAVSINWGLLLGGIALVLTTGAVTWLLATQQTSKKARKPTPRRPAKAAPTSASANKKLPTSPASPLRRRFCHECGEAAQPNDRFCRNCGTTLR
jgi:hypothetical protein